jgi:hypothetical protein
MGMSPSFREAGNAVITSYGQKEKTIVELSDESLSSMIAGTRKVIEQKKEFLKAKFLPGSLGEKLKMTLEDTIIKRKLRLQELLKEKERRCL